MVIDLDNASNNSRDLKTKFFENLRNKFSIIDINFESKKES